MAPAKGLHELGPGTQRSAHYINVPNPAGWDVDTVLDLDWDSINQADLQDIVWRRRG